MRRHHNISSVLDQLTNDRTEQFGVDRVQPGKRFVEKNQLGVMDKRSDELHLLLIAL